MWSGVLFCHRVIWTYPVLLKPWAKINQRGFPSIVLSMSTARSSFAPRASRSDSSKSSSESSFAPCSSLLKWQISHPTVNSWSHARLIICYATKVPTIVARLLICLLHASHGTKIHHDKPGFRVVKEVKTVRCALLGTAWFFWLYSSRHLLRNWFRPTVSCCGARLRGYFRGSLIKITWPPAQSWVTESQSYRRRCVAHCSAMRSWLMKYYIIVSS